MTDQVYATIRSDLFKLLELVGRAFPEEQRANVAGFIQADEYQLALEWMLEGLIDLRLPLPLGAADLVSRLAEQCGLSEELTDALAHFNITPGTESS